MITKLCNYKLQHVLWKNSKQSSENMSRRTDLVFKVREGLSEEITFEQMWKGKRICLSVRKRMNTTLCSQSHRRVALCSSDRKEGERKEARSGGDNQVSAWAFQAEKRARLKTWEGDGSLLAHTLAYRIFLYYRRVLSVFPNLRLSGKAKTYIFWFNIEFQV